jgi:hypothetical protein
MRSELSCSAGYRRFLRRGFGAVNGPSQALITAWDISRVAAVALLLAAFLAWPCAVPAMAFTPLSHRLSQGFFFNQGFPMRGLSCRPTVSVSGLPLAAIHHLHTL